MYIMILSEQRAQQIRFEGEAQQHPRGQLCHHQPSAADRHAAHQALDRVRGRGEG